MQVIAYAVAELLFPERHVDRHHVLAVVGTPEEARERAARVDGAEIHEVVFRTPYDPAEDWDVLPAWILEAAGEGPGDVDALLARAGLMLLGWQPGECLVARIEAL